MDNQKNTTPEESGRTTIGKFLRSLRIKRGMSLKAISEKMDPKLSEQCLSLIERDKMSLPPTRLELFANAYCTNDKEKEKMQELSQILSTSKIKMGGNPESEVLYWLLNMPKESRQRIIATVTAYDTVIPLKK